MITLTFEDLKGIIEDDAVEDLMDYVRIKKNEQIMDGLAGKITYREADRDMDERDELIQELRKELRECRDVLCRNCEHHCKCGPYTGPECENCKWAPDKMQI